MVPGRKDRLSDSYSVMLLPKGEGLWRVSTSYSVYRFERIGMDCNFSRFPGFVSFIAEHCYGARKPKP